LPTVPVKGVLFQEALHQFLATHAFVWYGITFGKFLQKSKHCAFGAAFLSYSCYFLRCVAVSLQVPILFWQFCEEQEKEEQEVEHNYQGDEDGGFENREHATSLGGASLLVSKKPGL